MRHYSLVIVLLLGFFTSRAKETAKWAPKNSNGISLIAGPQAAWKIENHFAFVTPVHDLYRRAAWLIRVEKAAPGPLTAYYDLVLEQLRNLPQIRPEVRRGLATEAPTGVFWSVLSQGELVLLNSRNEDSRVRLEGGKEVTLPPFTITII